MQKNSQSWYEDISKRLSVARRSGESHQVKSALGYFSKSIKKLVESTKDELIEGGSVGRKLDFIAQEMNREANTILSKANDLETSNCAISLKTEIEKVREQIQNIE